MKQALVSLIRTVVRARNQAVVSSDATLAQLTAAELRQVAGGAVECSPRGGW